MARVGVQRLEFLMESIKTEIDLAGTSLLNGLMRRKAVSGEQEDTTFIVGRGSKGTGGNPVDPYAVDATQQYPLGAKLLYNDREYRYARAAATIPAGNVVCTRNAAHATNHLNMSCLVAAVGATEVTIITAETDILENEYAGGYLYVNDGTGEGLAYKIKSHPAHDHSASPNCVMTLYDKIKVALVATGTSEVSLKHNKYTHVIKAPGTTPLTGEAIGVASSVLANNDFFWLQVKGPAAVLVSGTVVIGDSVCVTISTGTAGAVIARAADGAAQRVSRTIGQVMQVNASGEYALIDLLFE